MMSRCTSSSAVIFKGHEQNCLDSGPRRRGAATAPCRPHRIDRGRQLTYDGSNRFWVWASPLQEDAWGYGPSEDAAKAALEIWLASWLENFRPFFER